MFLDQLVTCITCTHIYYTAAEAISQSDQQTLDFDYTLSQTHILSLPFFILHATLASLAEVAT